MGLGLGLGHDVVDAAAAPDPALKEGGELAVVEVPVVHGRAAEARECQLARVAHLVRGEGEGEGWG